MNTQRSVIVAIPDGLIFFTGKDSCDSFILILSIYYPPFFGGLETLHFHKIQIVSQANFFTMKNIANHFGVHDAVCNHFTAGSNMEMSFLNGLDALVYTAPAFGLVALSAFILFALCKLLTLLFGGKNVLLWAAITIFLSIGLVVHWGLLSAGFTGPYFTLYFYPEVVSKPS